MKWIIVLLLFSSCLKHKDKDRFSVIFEERVGTTLILPFAPQQTESLKVVTYVNGDCSNCLEELSKWKEFYDKINNKNWIFVFYIYTQTEILLHQRILEQCFEFEYIVDDKKNFLRDNNLPYNGHLNTFLLDKNNRIILMGSPILNDKISEIYIDEIEEYSVIKI